MKEFVEKIVRGDCSDQESGNSALREVLTAHAAYKSAKTKQWEKVSVENLT